MNNLRPFIELQTIGSTNDYAEQLIKTRKVQEGTVIFAHNQNSGKGQGEHTWESEPEMNATFSLVLYPTFLFPDKQFMINKVITLGILDFLSGLPIKKKLAIKWPNDIYAGQSKLGGILIQNSICGSLYESCIVGIGVNINQEKFNPILPNPVSLKQLIKEDFSVKKAIDLMVECIDNHYQQLKDGSIGIIDKGYKQYLLGFNEWRSYTVNKMVIKGRIVGVNEFGNLLMELENSSIHHFTHGEIEFIFS